MTPEQEKKFDQLFEDVAFMRQQLEGYTFVAKSEGNESQTVKNLGLREYLEMELKDRHKMYSDREEKLLRTQFCMNKFAESIGKPKEMREARDEARNISQAELVDTMG